VGSFEPAVHRTIVIVDVENFGDPARTNVHQLAVRAGMYEALQQSFAQAGIGWDACVAEDRGDGVMVLVSPEVPKSLLVSVVPVRLAALLAVHNAAHGAMERIRLRMALHAGEMHRDAHGWAGVSVNRAFRLIDAPACRSALRDSSGVLALIVSDWFYDEVVRHDADAEPAVFRQVRAAVKETSMMAWVRVLAAGEPSVSQEAGAGSGGLPVGVPVGRLPAEIRGRDALLAELRASVLSPAFMRSGPASRRSRPGRTWILAGMGGLGKSTIALAIAREARRSRGWRVWWVTATDSASLAGGMVEILYQLRAPETVIRQVREGTPAAAERAWDYLNGAHRAGRRWLLVLDNVDDPAVLAAPGAASPADYTGWLRPDPRGAVIVTTRHKDPRTWGNGVTLREVPPLDDDAAAKVLADLAPGIRDPDGRQARELGRRLGGLPLALYLAGSYLGSGLARWRTFTGYRDALDGAELPAALADLGDPAGQPRIDIQRTWGLSLDALAADGRPQARPLLALLACYAPATPVPVKILRPCLLTGLLAAGRGEAGDAGPHPRMLAGLRGLAMAGLIDVAARDDGRGEQAVTVHPVVADAHRARLRGAAAADLPEISTAAIRLLRAACDELDGEGPGDWPAWHGLVPHILALLEWIAGLLDAAALADLLEISSAAAEALVLGGTVGTAETLARAGTAVATSLSADHPARLAIRLALASALAEQARNRDADQLYREVLVDQERVLGPDHPDTLDTRYRHVRVLGFVRPPRAEQPHRQLLADQERVLGASHLATLATRHWLGRLLVRLGRYEEAETTYRQVLDGRRRLLGDRHPDTMVTRHTLAWAIARQGRHAEAERQFRQVITDQRDVLGDDHFHVLGSGRALGWCISKQGRHAEAERYLRQVLAAQRRVRGDDHPATLETLRTLAHAIAAQGRPAEAEDLYRQALNARPQLYSEDHPATLTAHHMLGLLLAGQGRPAEARELLAYALAGRERIFGPQHPDTQETRQAMERLTTSRGSPRP
jgi:tetratricopeptide (TPR) repeat protein